MDESTREAQRLAWLVAQKRSEGMSQREFSKLTGIGYTYINALANLETGSPRGMGAHIVALVRNGVGVHPDYFYDDYEGEADHKVYLLANRREEARLAAIETEQAQMRRDFAEMVSKVADYGRLAAENLELKQQNAALERQLSRLSARARKSSPVPGGA